MLCVTLWGDAQCTQKPSGLTDTLYVKFEQRFGFGDEHLWGGYSHVDKMLFIFTPSETSPNETYQVRAFRNYLSEEQIEPFEAGSLVEIVNALGPENVDNFQTEFVW